MVGGSQEYANCQKASDDINHARRQQEAGFVRRLRGMVLCLIILSMMAANHSPHCVELIISAFGVLSFVIIVVQSQYDRTIWLGLPNLIFIVLAIAFVSASLMTGIRHVLGLPQVL